MHAVHSTIQTLYMYNIYLLYEAFFRNTVYQKTVKYLVIEINQVAMIPSSQKLPLEMRDSSTSVSVASLKLQISQRELKYVSTHMSIYSHTHLRIGQRRYVYSFQSNLLDI